MTTDNFLIAIGSILILSGACSWAGQNDSIETIEEVRPDIVTQAIKVIINQKYDGEPLPILENEDVEDWLKRAGIRIITNNTSEYEYNIIIDIQGEAIKKSYQQIITQKYTTHYSGASVKGNVKLVHPDGIIKVDFTQRHNSPSSISKEYINLSDAPYKEALLAKEALPRAFASVLIQHMGESVVDGLMTADDWRIRRGVVEVLSGDFNWDKMQYLTKILQTDINAEVRSVAASVLGQVGDYNAIESLIKAVDDSYIVRKSSFTALENITKQKFGSRAAEWKKWWQDNRGNPETPYTKTFQPAKLVRIIIDQEYDGQKMDILEKNEISEWLSVIGADPHNASPNEYDHELTIKIRGKALSREYSGRAIHYSGAKLEGLLTLCGKEGCEHVPFGSVDNPASFIMKRYPYPRDAPFEAVLLSSLHDKLCLLMCRCYGKEVLPDALNTKNSRIRIAAINRLGTTDDVQSTDLLIRSLQQDHDPSVRKAALLSLSRVSDKRVPRVLFEAMKRDAQIKREAHKSLKKLSGQDYEADSDQWRDWLEEQNISLSVVDSRSFKDVNVVSLVIDQLYEDEFRRLVKDNDMISWLKIAGIEMLQDNGHDADSELLVRIRGIGIKHKYSSGDQYTQAVINGTITFSNSTDSKYRTFYGKSNKPFLISGEYPSPQDAPFNKALETSTLRKEFALLMAESFGDHILLEALVCENSRIRRDAAEALGELKKTDSIKMLVKVMQGDTNKQVRIAAATALGYISHTSVVEPLIEALADEEWEVKSAAIKSLGTIKDIRAVEPLIDIISTTKRNAIVHKDAVRALSSISGMSFGSDHRSWLDWWTSKKEQDGTN
jgi:HEAT repeat protein